MIRRILNSRLPLMVVTPVKVFDVKYFNAIYTAGALPVFDTEFLSHENILESLDALSQEECCFGVRLADHDNELIQKIKGQHIINLDLIVVPLSENDVPADFDNFSDTKIVLELKDIDINEKIDAIGPHAIVLKGNEAGGKVSRYSSFILMQWYLKNSTLPIFIHGGVGKYTAAGMLAAGVSGLVMDSQFLMTDEAPVSDNFKKLLGMVDESDSTEIIFNEKDIYRVFAKLGTKIVKDLKREAIEFTDDPQGRKKVYQAVCDNMAQFDDKDTQFIQSLFYLGQDGVFAKNFVKTSTRITDIIPEFFKTIGENLEQIDAHDPVKPGSEFAKDQGTRFPLIQGPMANISDNSDFANKVLEHGALPFFAVGSLPDFLAEKMLKDGSEKVDNFGAGLVGIEAFNPMVHKHLELVKKYKVPYALFAGGIPSQAQELEKAGTKTYLHTPSVSMMENAIKNGCKRFIFEGGEAGGHVGMLSSMVLWEDAIATLLNKDYDLSELYLVFAGGISTRFASFFISGMTSFIAARGAKIGLQVGTAYLFSDEIVDSKAVKKQYQDIIIRENKTVLIGRTLGLASRTAPTNFARMMVENEYDMIKSKESLEKRKRAFEKNQIGSLLIGAKGFLPDFKNPGEENYTWFEDDEHAQRGNFLVGDSLAFFDRGVTIKQIHDNYFQTKSDLYKNLNILEIFSSPENKINDEIAVVGIGCTLPDANDPDSLWENILTKKYSISEMPKERFDRDLYYDPDRSAEDKTYTILAGHADQFKFDQDRFGYTKDKAKQLSRSQKMVLQTAYKAVEDAGYLGEDNRFVCDDPARTAVIIATCLSNELGNELQFKYWYPEVVSIMEKTQEYKTLSDEEKDSVKQALKEGMEGKNPGYDPVHGILLNIEASRIANHLGVRGANYIIDAACASSVTALRAATGELLSGEHDQVIVGGVNTHLAPESFIGFAKMGTLSAKGSYPFDERADGFILGEGSVIFVLKRMKDALRDNNKILGVINSIGASSDGRGKAIAAPNPNGQVLSVQRCYERIRPDIKPEDIGFIEAHGTSTTIGDQAELQTLNAVYKKADAGVSSIKSQIGHLLGCAGSAGLLKALLAVNKGMLPPNGQFETLSRNHDLKDSGMYIVKDAKEWPVQTGVSRKAAVSSYGFGGINYHIVVEQMTDGYKPLDRNIFADPSYDYNDDRIVVAGLGVFLPGAKNKEEFWEKLTSGEKQLSDIPAENFNNEAYAGLGKESFYHLPKVKAGVVKDFKFNNLKYRMPPKMVKSIERGQIFGLEAANEALESSGLLEQLGNGSNQVGVILGTIAGERQSKNIVRTRKLLIGNVLKACSGVDAQKSEKISQQVVDAIRKTIPENNEDTTPGLLSNIISGRIANYFGLNGANYVIDASCASAFIAMRNAARNLKHKDMDFVLAGGVDTNLYPAVLMAFKRLGLLSEGDCNFFDSRADGYVMGEGAAIHLMTTYKKAKEYNLEILGEINECTVRSSVPDHLLAPSEHTFISTINETYQKSGIRKRDIQHLDLFAFSNIFGDIIEKQVIENCFDHPMHCGNIKSQFGYFKAANPAVALAKMMLMNKKGQILPDFNYDPDHSVLNDSAILKPARQLVVRPKGQPARFASNVNGIGGNHCHMIMGTLPFVLEKKQAVVEAEFKAASGDDIVMVDHAYSADKTGKKLRMVALLSGQGAQRSRMMKELFERDAHIRQIMERGEAIFKEARGYSLLDMMFGSDDAINSTQNTQPAVFLSSAAVFSRLSRDGFSPDYFIGHSVGEYTALFCSGIIGFDDAMRLIIKRSDLMYEATLKVPGRIMVVFKNEKETEHLIQKSFVSNIYITNKNSEKQTAVSGTAENIEKFCTYLMQEEIFYKKLNLTGAFHTPLLKEASEELREYLVTLTFKEVPYGRIISNTTAKPYPERPEEVKDLLARQIISPVEFIKSIENVYDAGRTHFIEIGPSRLLVNLLKNINIEDYHTMVSVDAKEGEIKSFEACKKYLADHNSIFGAKSVSTILPEIAAPVPTQEAHFAAAADFESFKENNSKVIDQILFKEYQRQKRENAITAMERYNFNTDRIMISGVSVGLPGKARRVFAADNFDAILNGENFIESITPEMQELFIDKNITKLFKQPDGNARFVQITKAEDVIHLAGQLGYFDLSDEYGIKEEYDIVMGISIAAGIEALKDANIPLVMQYKKVNDGKTMIPDGFALPEDMQEDTGVILTSLWPNGETIMTELEKYLYQKFFLKPYEEFESIYYFLMEKVTDIEVKNQLTEWFFKAKSRKKTDFETYKFDRDFLANACPLGSAHLAQIIKAKGPNTIVSSACASTTLAIGIAEDWIRVGRCKRVLVVGGENATSETQCQWVGSGFLALGAGTIKKRVSEAAKPFDVDRNGTILGAGAVGLVVESETCVNERGMNGQCEILGTHIANSAYHTYNIDVPHMAREMKKFIDKIEKQNGLRKADYADKLLFMSHETYTPARGGSADAEVIALQTAFPDHLNSICISNTKGLTGHTLGAAIEDVVLIKALQKRKAPPIANLKKIPDHFKALNFSSNKRIDSEYGFHLAAGFGSHFAFMFVKREEENQVEGNEMYQNWVKRITGSDNPQLKIIDNTLCAVAGGEALPQTVRKVKKPVEPQVPIISVTPAPAPAITAEIVMPVPAPVPGPAGLSALETIKTIIAEQTGYTADMLEDELDLEADLGIDTVKQVEIFGNIAGKFGFSVPDDLKLRDLNTIAKLAEYVSSKVDFSTITAPSAAAPAGVLAGASAPVTAAPVESVPESVAADLSSSDALAMIKEVIAEQTGYTSDMLEDELDLEADLGIDTVKQVEIFGKVAGKFGFSVPDDLKLRDLNTIAKLGEYVSGKANLSALPAPLAAASAPVSAVPVESVPDPVASGPSSSDALAMIKEVIAEQTGYTADMLEDGLDLEADLGIDTVKQVEIFGKVAGKFGFSVPDDLKLRDLNTIAKLGEYVSSKVGVSTAPAVSIAQPAQAQVELTLPETQDAPGAGEDVTAIIKEVIAIQTGYTADMLEEDLDLEADLGIDTVKQVEIFGKVAGKFGFSVPDDLKLRDLNTIAKLSVYIKEAAGVSRTIQEKPAAVDSQVQTAPVTSPVKTTQEDEFPDPLSPIKRLIVRAEESKIPTSQKKDLKGKTIIVSLDDHGFAQDVIKKIKKQKGKVITIGSKGADFKFDLTDVKATEQRVEEFKAKYADLDGFIHLAPLNYYFDKKEGVADSDASLNTTIKSFFVMVKSLFEILDKPGNMIGTITFDSVVFPYMEGCQDIHPMFGGLSGMLKTVNKELADTMVKVVDFSYKQPKKSISRITDLFLNELTGSDTRCEVGYKNNKRYVVSMKPSIADRNQQIIDNGDTMLVTGGAGGITYEIIKKVVDKYKVNLIILDINDIYSTDKKFLDKASTQPELMGLLKQDMPGVKPVEIKRALDRLMRVRQSIDNIEHLESKGISVDYNCVDVTNLDAVTAAVNKYDKIDGVFHAAGMEMSQFIAKKELWSFELVVDVKVKGMRNLLQALKDREYKYFFTFSSVTARFGNEGQVDYTSANDYLGKTLFRQQQLHPDRTYKVYAWTAWGGVGMATNPTVRAVLEERGLQFLPMEQGVKFFMADLLDKTESEMVFSGIDYSFDKDGLLGDPSEKQFPFLDDPVSKNGDSMTYSRVLDIERDLFLHDHTMGDVPLFLGSTGVETMAEVARSISEDRPCFVELSDFQIPYGIKLLKGRPKELLITGEKKKDGKFDCTITSLFKNPKGIVMGDPKLHYQGQYTFAKKPLKQKKIKLPEFNKITWTGDFESLVYNPKRLFMFGLFGTITDINSFDGQTLITTINDLSDKEFFKGVKDPNFVAAPILVDAMFQTGGLLEFFTTSRTVLPYRIKSLKFYKDVERNTPYYCITHKRASGEETNTYDLKLVDKKGNVFIEVDSFEMVKLNQLDPEDRIADRVTFARLEQK